MSQFNDRNGRNWTLDITIGDVKRVKAALGFDLLNLAGGESLEKLLSDPMLLCDVLWVLVEPQAQTAGITDEDFGRSLAGETIEQATEAMLDALINFFPRERRQVMNRVRETMRIYDQKQIQMIETFLDSGELEKRLDRQIEETVQSLTRGNSSGNSPESSAPIPAE